ncbi:MAG TPA: flagellar hook-length control protein FliK [Defluviitaleaceae bacterium]|jgi:flagellar hook-length control protein FliK|nr:flagellar hook-length control protein FliK [Defluviitaleaceae bacterium]
MNVQIFSFDFTTELAKSFNNGSVKNANSQKGSFEDLLNDSYENKNIFKSKASTTGNANSKINVSEKDYHSHKSDTLKKVVTTDDSQINPEPLPEERQIIKNIAEKTDMSEEEIVESLQQLGLTVYDLFSPTNINLFLQKLFNVTSSIDLLSIPDVNQLYKDIMSIMEHLKVAFPFVDTHFMQAEETVKFNLKNDSEDFILNSVVDQQSMNNIDHSELMEQVDHIIDQDLEQNARLLDKSQEQRSGEEVLTLESKKNNPQSNKKTFDNKFNNDESFLNEDTFANSEEMRLENRNIIIQQNFETHLQSTENITENVTGRTTNDLMNQQNIVEQMVEQIKINVGETSSEMSLQLKPDHLGKLSLKIVTERGIVTAQFMAENQAVKEIIEANFNQLKDALSEQGLEVKNLEVFVKQDFQKHHSNFMKEKSSKSGKRISNILSDFVNNPEETYLNPADNPYQRSESIIDYSA